MLTPYTHKKKLKKNKSDFILEFSLYFSLFERVSGLLRTCSLTLPTEYVPFKVT